MGIVTHVCWGITILCLIGAVYFNRKADADRQKAIDTWREIAERGRKD